jgi:hypothetical protein
MPRVDSGLAGPKFGATHVWASSRSPCFLTAQNGNCTENSWLENGKRTQNLGRKNFPDSAEHHEQAWLSLEFCRLSDLFCRLTSSGRCRPKTICKIADEPSLEVTARQRITFAGVMHDRCHNVSGNVCHKSHFVRENGLLLRLPLNWHM